MSVTDFHPIHICRQSRQHRDFRTFAYLKKCMSVKMACGRTVCQQEQKVSVYKVKVYVNSYVGKIGGRK